LIYTYNQGFITLIRVKLSAQLARKKIVYTIYLKLDINLPRIKRFSVI